MAHHHATSPIALLIASIAALLSIACGTQSRSPENKRSEDDHVAVVTTTTPNNTGNAAPAAGSAPAAAANPAGAPPAAAPASGGQNATPPAANAQPPDAAPTAAAAAGLDPLALLTQLSQQAVGQQQVLVDAQLAAIKAKRDAERARLAH